MLGISNVNDCTVTDVDRAVNGTDAGYHYRLYYDIYSSPTKVDVWTDMCAFVYSDLLLYKGWIGKDEWLRYLYHKRVKESPQKFRGYPAVVLRRRTNNSTTPIRRYKPGNRR